MTAPLVSVIALTRDRPREFLALLQSLEQQRMRDFEVIVVGAAADLRDHGDVAGFIGRTLYLRCEDENISMSRNIGIAHSAGEIIAFIDDDAAPEPDWLTEIVKPFEQPHIGAVGGFVRGRNGIDFQWRGALIDRYGAHAELTAEDLVQRDFADPTGEHFLSTVGVNSAFRREALMEIGGFDERFHYFLDESDVCVRLAKAGWGLAFAPRAEVHHAYAESRERAANRAPRDLYQVAASRAYFGLVHGDPDWVERRIKQFQDEQSERLTKFVQLGRLSRRQAGWIEDRMIEGVAEGRRRYSDGPRRGATMTPTPQQRPKPFVDYHRARRLRVALVVANANARRVSRLAERLAGEGCEATVIDFGLNARRLKVGFRNGVWRHGGGVLGRDQIGAPPPVPRRCVRVRREVERVSEHRDFDVVIRPKAQKFRIGNLPPRPVGSLLPGYVAEPLRPDAASQLAGVLGADL